MWDLKPVIKEGFWFILYFSFFGIERMSTNYRPQFDTMGTQPGNSGIQAPGRSSVGMGSGPGSDSWHGAVQHVKFVSNATDEDFQTGRTKPTVVTVEQPTTINILVDSKDRLDKDVTNPNFTASNFRVTLNSNLFRSRFLRVRKVILARPFNVTIHNNHMILKESLADSEFSIDLPPGFYNTQTFANTLAALLNAASPNASVYSIVFNSVGSDFIITSNPEPFFIETECEFITFGHNFVPFESFPAISTVAAVGLNSVTSGVSSMIYTRYVYLCSEAFNSWSYADSKSSNIKAPGNIIAIVECTQMYNTLEFELGRPIVSKVFTVETLEAPMISVRNPQRNLSSEADVSLFDEYGFELNKCYQLFDHVEPTQSGFAFWLEVTF